VTGTVGTLLNAVVLAMKDVEQKVQKQAQDSLFTGEMAGPEAETVGALQQQ